MWSRPNSQEVGLEAAILERVRNSSLVEVTGADNSTGLKPSTEAMEFRVSALDWQGSVPRAVKVACEGCWSAGK